MKVIRTDSFPQEILMRDKDITLSAKGLYPFIYLHLETGVSIENLAKEVSLTKGEITPFIDELEDGGYISISEEVEQ